MNTPTPETDQWEAYCDECYYHMWRLRRKTERGWHDGFHIHTGEEAKGLCDLLNKLERELDRGLMENRDLWSSNAELTEQRDRLAGALETITITGSAQYCREIADNALQSLTPNVQVMASADT